MDERIRSHWRDCWRSHPECAAALLERIAASGVEHDDARVGYVVVQVDRAVWDRLREAT